MTKTWRGGGAMLGVGIGTGDIPTTPSGVSWWTFAAWAPPHPAAASIATVRIAAGRWELEARPERGGRITSLRLDGEELLDQGIGVDQPTAEGFVEGGAFGWDEMVPNLEPTSTLPDHGEAWRLPWAVLGPGAMRCRGRLVSWELERRVSLGEAVDVAYVYRNVGHEPHTAFWCAHPLFKYEPVMHIELAEGTSSKVFLPRGSVDRMQIGRAEVSWDSSITPDVAVWMCNGDLGGYRQVAVEPSWTRPEFAPGETFSWWLQISAL